MHYGKLLLVISLLLVTSVSAKRPNAFIQAGAATSFVVTSDGGNSLTAGVKQDLLILAVDSKNQVDVDFEGTVKLESSDVTMELPAEIEFTKLDQGVRRVGPVSFGSLGEQSVTAQSDGAKGVGTFVIKRNPLSGPTPKRLGDLNGDSSITQEDVDLMSAFLSGVQSFNPIQLLAADMDRDGEIDEKDKKRIQKSIGDALPKDATPPQIEIKEPTGELVDRLTADIRVTYSDAGSGVLEDSLVIFSERGLSGGVLVGPGSNMVSRLSFATEVRAEETHIDLPSSAFPVGHNTLRAAILDKKGNIGVATEAFVATGVEIVRQEGETIGEPLLLIGVHEPELAIQASWETLRGEGEFTNEIVHLKAQVLTANLTVSTPVMIDAAFAVASLAAVANGTQLGRDEKTVVVHADPDKPFVGGTTAHFGNPGDPTRIGKIFVFRPEGAEITGIDIDVNAIKEDSVPRGGAGKVTISRPSRPRGQDEIEIRVDIAADAPEGLYVFAIPVAIGWKDKDGRQQEAVVATVALGVYVFVKGSAADPAVMIEANLKKIEEFIKKLEKGSEEDKKNAKELKDVLDKAKTVAIKEMFGTKVEFVGLASTVITEGTKVSLGKTSPSVTSEGLYQTLITLGPGAFRSEKDKVETMIHEFRHAANFAEVNEDAKKQKKSVKDLDPDGDGVTGENDPNPDKRPPDDSEEGARKFGEKFSKLMFP